jgi:ATP-dependent DNA ligase
MRRRRPQHFYVFDLLWLDGQDLRDRPLVERKRLLREIVPPQPAPLLYVDHVVADGVGLYGAICARGYGRDRCEAGVRRVHARSDDVGEDQEPEL